MDLCSNPLGGRVDGGYGGGVALAEEEGERVGRRAS